MQWGYGQDKGKGKGQAAGPPRVNFNVPGISNACIDGLPHSGVAVFQGNPAEGVEYCERLNEALQTYGPGECSFDNIDVSKVPWEQISFSCLMDVLIEHAVVTKRFKAFRCGLDDDDLGRLAEWFDKLPATGLPSEIHLSHNKLTQRGFDQIFSSIEAKRQELPGAANPIWLRVENNAVDVAYVNQLEQQGRVLYCQDIKGCRRAHPTACVAMPQLQTTGQAAAPPPTRQAAAPQTAWQAPSAPQARVVPPPSYAQAAPSAPGGGFLAAAKARMSQAGYTPQTAARPALPAATTAKGGAKAAGKGGGQSSWNSKQEDSNSEEQRVHPSDKAKTPYTYAGFVEFAAGDAQKAARMWKESKPVASTPGKSYQEPKGEQKGGKGGAGGKGLQASSEEERVHPSDKGKTPYTYAGFVDFAQGDEQKAQRMWKESKPVEKANGSSWQGRSDDSKQSGRNETQWQKDEGGAQKRNSEFMRPIAKAVPAKKPKTEAFDAFGGQATLTAVGTRGGAAGRVATVAAAPKKPPVPAQDELPPGWQKEWSDEYGIPFYWHAEREESSWEVPTA